MDGGYENKNTGFLLTSPSLPSMCLSGQCLVDCLVVFVYSVFLGGWTSKADRGRRVLNDINNALSVRDGPVYSFGRVCTLNEDTHSGRGSTRVLR
jgi:hypothetical protein